jgi:hypothetical protein
MKPRLKSIIQHYLLNWILISRYHLVHRGIPKALALRYLSLFETFLKKINVVT